MLGIHLPRPKSHGSNNMLGIHLPVYSSRYTSCIKRRALAQESSFVLPKKLKHSLYPQNPVLYYKKKTITFIIST